MNEKVGNQKLESIAISLDAEKAKFDPVKDGPSLSHVWEMKPLHSGFLNNLKDKYCESRHLPAQRIPQVMYLPRPLPQLIVCDSRQELWPAKAKSP